MDIITSLNSGSEFFHMVQPNVNESVLINGVAMDIVSESHRDPRQMLGVEAMDLDVSVLEVMMEGKYVGGLHYGDGCEAIQSFKLAFDGNVSRPSVTLIAAFEVLGYNKIVEVQIEQL